MQLRHLDQQLTSLSGEISMLLACGNIAPAHTWLQKYVVKKPNGKKYFYYRAMKEVPKSQSTSGKASAKFYKYLGKKGSRKYNSFVRAIARRNKLKLLRRRKRKLEKLYQRLTSLQESLNTALIPIDFDKIPELTAADFRTWATQFRQIAKLLKLDVG